MRLTIVGCSGSFPGPDSPASCYLIEAPYDGRTFRLVLDLGSGALGALQRHAELESIDAVALSHLHVDHCLDLCSFYVVRKYHPGGPWPPLPVYGPEGTAARLTRASDLTAGAALEDEFTFHPYPDGELSLGPFTVTVDLVEHPVPAYAIRVRHGDSTLVYSGDTGPCGTLEALAKDCDLLLAEASFVEGDDNPMHVHLTGKQAALIATAAGAQRLVLTHIPPWHSREAVLAEAAPYFPGELSVALPGQTYDV